MAKRTRSNADDTPSSSAPGPRAGRRRADRVTPASGEPGSSPDPSPDPPDPLPQQPLRQHDVSAPDTPDSGPAPQVDRDDTTSLEPGEHEKIRLRAYHLYLDRGAFHGADFDDWLQAEMELKKR